MSAPEPKLDGGLAWDLSEILDIENIDLPRAQVEGITRKLTEKGYSRGGRTGGFGGLLSQLEDVGTKMVDEFGPLIDSLRKTK